MIEYRRLCDCILSTWCYMTSLHVMRSPKPPTVYAGALWLCLNLYTSPGWEISPHERHQCLPRERRGVENPCTFLMGKISQAALKVIKRWWKIKANGMHSFLFQMKLCPHLILLIWTCASSYCHTKLLPFLLDSWRHTWTIRQENLSLLPKVIVWCWICEHRWLKRDWMVNQLQSHFMQCNQGHFLIFSQRRMQFICHSKYTVYSLWTPIPS